jgi:hypothetical protein
LGRFGLLIRLALGHVVGVFVLRLLRHLSVSVLSVSALSVPAALLFRFTVYQAAVTAVDEFEVGNLRGLRRLLQFHALPDDHEIEQAIRTAVRRPSSCVKLFMAVILSAITGVIGHGRRLK